MNHTKFSIKRFIGFSLILVLGVAILTFFGFQVKGQYEKIESSIEEINFAFNHPEIVKATREDYQERQNKLNESFLKKEKTSEEKLIEELTNQLKESQSKK